MKKRVLIADDSVDICESIAMNIDDLYDVLVAYDGDEALRIALSERIDVILLDLWMPVRDGATVMATLREHGCSAPVILTSASPDLERTAHRLQAFDYLAKPFGIDEIEAKLARAAGQLPASR